MKTGSDRFRRYSKLPLKLSSPSGLIAALSIAMLSALLFSGCGYNPEDPIYDTASNPEKFPQPALDLVDLVESGQQINVEEAIEAFVDLYSGHMELLDNDDWKEIVSRMGLKLRIRADEMALEGVDRFASASDYYNLASFARPDDPKIKHRANLFGCWSADSTDDLLNLAVANENNGFSTASLQSTIEAYKRFAYTDSLHYEFASQILLDPLLRIPYSEYSSASEALRDSLPLSDRAFLDAVELHAESFDSSLCKFEQPQIELLHFEIVPLAGERYRAELYFNSAAKIDENYSIAFWVDAVPPSELDNPDSRELYLPFDFVPLPETSHWPAEETTMAVHEFECSGVIRKISVGLYVTEDKQVRYAAIAGIDGNLVSFPVHPNMAQTDP